VTLVDQPGLAGAVAGLGLGLVNAALAMRAMQRRMAGEDEIAPGGVEAADKVWRRMRGALRLVCFGVFPLIGYGVGRWLG
jgi:hypothetical protein